MRITPFWITLLAVNAHATLILSTDFTGRTANGKTAENIPWTTGGVQDPGDLTWVVETGTTTNTDLFDTGAAQNHFAPDLNIFTAFALRPFAADRDTEGALLENGSI